MGIVLTAGSRDVERVDVAGVILNQIGSARHEAMLLNALKRAGIDVFGALPKDPTLKLPSRHLGLVQAGEHADLEQFIENASTLIEKHCDLSRLGGFIITKTPSRLRLIS